MVLINVYIVPQAPFWWTIYAYRTLIQLMVASLAKTITVKNANPTDIWVSILNPAWLFLVLPIALTIRSLDAKSANLALCCKRTCIFWKIN